MAEMGRWAAGKRQREAVVASINNGKKTTNKGKKQVVFRGDTAIPTVLQLLGDSFDDWR